MWTWFLESPDLLCLLFYDLYSLFYYPPHLPNQKPGNPHWILHFSSPSWLTGHLLLSILSSQNPTDPKAGPQDPAGKGRAEIAEILRGPGEKPLLRGPAGARPLSPLRSLAGPSSSPPGVPAHACPPPPKSRRRRGCWGEPGTGTAGGCEAPG